jgi:FtsP/CotA-like multicopper oxidase with cupredoxin domain
LYLLAESWSPALQNLTASQRTGELFSGGRVMASFTLTAEQRHVTPLPSQLSHFPRLSLDDVDRARPPRRITLSMMRGQAMLNGRVFGDMYEVADHDRVKLGVTEIWEFTNTSMGMRMLHPMHVHNVQFRVLERNMLASTSPFLRQLSDGFVDEGLKDVVLVRPGERVRVLLRFEQHTGIYLYHCHILEHEDLGMMQNFMIEA